MTAHQRIVRVRRNYNKWVANQTLEDYALRFTAKSARKWSSLRVANTAIGAISFLALEAIGGAITVNYGFANAASAILVVGALIFLTGLPIAWTMPICPTIDYGGDGAVGPGSLDYFWTFGLGARLSPSGARQ